MDTENIITNYIEKKKLSKDIDTELKAMETIILSDDNLRQDSRIKVIKGRETFTVTDKGYELLKVLGYQTEVTETHKIDFKDLDITARNTILKDNTLFELKTSKESIRINDKGE